MFPVPTLWAQSRGAEGQPGCLLRVEVETDAPYRSGPSKVWLKTKNPESAAVRREREEQWR